MLKIITLTNEPKLITDKDSVTSTSRVEVDQQVKQAEVFKYLQFSQGAGQLIAQLNLQVLSLKPANTQQHGYS